MKSDKYFVRLDEDSFDDPKIRTLIKRGGYEAVGMFFRFLTIVRRYKEHGYRVPLEDTADNASWDFHVEEEQLDKLYADCVEIGLLISDGEFIWSERRKKDLEEQEAKKMAYREGAAKTNAKRAQKRADARKKKEEESIPLPPKEEPKPDVEAQGDPAVNEMVEALVGKTTNTDPVDVNGLREFRKLHPSPCEITLGAQSS